MTLRELIRGARLDGAVLSAPGGERDDPVISALAYRSDSAGPGTLFFCVPGFSADGHQFAPDAVERGAAAIVCERPLGLGVPELVVESARAAMAPLAACFWGHPTRELDVIGVTGTNGKTTTTFFARHALESAGRRTALLGTVQSVIGGGAEEVERTTPEAIDLQSAFRRMVDAGDDACVMEVSSHALALHRADAIHFDCAVFTNLTQDHLDFHETFAEYFGAKRRLFARTSPPRANVVNVDDERGSELADEIAMSGQSRLITFAVDAEADFRASDVRSGPSGSRFVLTAEGEQTEVELPVPGLFNVYNALGAIAATVSVGVELRAAAGALANAPTVPGRFEPVDEGQQFTVLVDYAHTPDSIANVLRAARGLLEANGGRLVCVFGAGGDRDREKRPLMGEQARALADHVIVTSDNPRSEDPEQIIAAIVAGAERAAAGAKSSLEVEPDRRSAIAAALLAGRPGDVIVIAGKGHEQGQELAGGKKIPFDDREVAREQLRARGPASARPAA